MSNRNIRKRANELFNSMIGKECYIKQKGRKGQFVKPVRVRVLGGTPALYFEYKTYPCTYGYVKYTDLVTLQEVGAK